MKNNLKKFKKYTFGNVLCNNTLFLIVFVRLFNETYRFTILEEKTIKNVLINNLCFRQIIKK